MKEDPFDVQAAAAEVDRLRGTYLSRMCVAEIILDGVLLVFFEVPPFRKERLARGTLLSRLGMAAKLDTLQYILKTTSLDENYKTTMAELSSANEFRNVLAHAAVGPFTGPLPTRHLTQFKNGKLIQRELSIAELERWIERAGRLHSLLVELDTALRELPDGDEGLVDL